MIDDLKGRESIKANMDSFKGGIRRNEGENDEEFEEKKRLITNKKFRKQRQELEDKKRDLDEEMEDIRFKCAEEIEKELLKFILPFIGRPDFETELKSSTQRKINNLCCGYFGTKVRHVVVVNLPVPIVTPTIYYSFFA
jgi:hypothetical protein